MYAKLLETISEFSESQISHERKKTLQPLIEFISQKQTEGEDVRLNFICTHNSRRSHLAQVWAQAMAYHFRLNNVCCYSGGTEATALYPQVAETLREQGFEIDKLSETHNPVYAVKFSGNEHPVIGFSKKHDHHFNPTTGFCAVMTCSSADQDCPFIPGAEKRIAVPFEDPKIFDGTNQMDNKYAEKSIEIGREMWFVFKEAR